jgi:hypothetical protein
VKFFIHILYIISIYTKYIFVVPMLIFGSIFSIWIINRGVNFYVSNHNDKILARYNFQEGETSIIYDKIERWRTTFDGGSQLLAVHINTLDIRNYNSETDSKILTCFLTAREMSHDYISRKVYDINYTNIWYFGIPLETKTVICKV